jgi:CheY-like chemotaxis protein
MTPVSGSIVLNYRALPRTTSTEVGRIRGPLRMYSGRTMRPRRIGVVENDPSLIESYLLTLNARGHEVVISAESGEEIVRAARDGKLKAIDVIIMDYLMGDMNGLQAAAVVNEYNPRIKIIIASGEDEIVSEVSLSGLVHLRKPFSRIDLLAAVE